MQPRRGCLGMLTGCLTKVILWSCVAVVFFWLLTIALNPWALKIGGRSTPFLYWHGVGTVVSKDGRQYPLYVTFWPGRPSGFSGGGRREGRRKVADVSGQAWLCLAPGHSERMDISGAKFGGYASTDDSLFAFRLLEWRKLTTFNYPHRGFFDIAGQFHGGDLVMDRTNEQGIQLNTGPFIDHATVTLHYAGKSEFEAACRDASGQLTQVPGQ
jgi:hypothetical protein